MAYAVEEQDAGAKYLSVSWRGRFGCEIDGMSRLDGYPHTRLTCPLEGSQEDADQSPCECARHGPDRPLASTLSKAPLTFKNRSKSDPLLFSGSFHFCDDL